MVEDNNNQKQLKIMTQEEYWDIIHSWNERYPELVNKIYRITEYELSAAQKEHIRIRVKALRTSKRRTRRMVSQFIQLGVDPTKSKPCAPTKSTPRKRPRSSPSATNTDTDMDMDMDDEYSKKKKLKLLEIVPGEEFKDYVPNHYVRWLITESKELATMLASEREREREMKSEIESLLNPNICIQGSAGNQSTGDCKPGLDST